MTGSLHAASPGGTGPFNFLWYRWNNTANSFSDLFQTELSATTSSVTGLAEGGYRVNISDGSGYTASLTAWIFIDRPWAGASLMNPMKHCDYVALKGIAAVDTFYYKDPTTGFRIKLPNGVKFLWSSNPVSSIPYPDLLLNPQTFSPPLVNVTYKLHVTDSFTCSSESSFYYESIHVKADFSPDPVKGEAPLEVTFTNKSIRGTQFIWKYGDDTTAVLTDTLPHTHIYYKPGEYSVKMSLVSKLGCEDSLRFEKIIVEPSDIDIPNVFTPDGDGYNDWFRVDTRSIRNLSVQVFSRSGLKVYGFYGEGEKLKDWTGWDGNVNNSSIKAAPGIYFYIIRAYGWDNIVYDSKEYRGSVYLFR
jgi:gliding motility-associated-like protein